MLLLLALPLLSTACRRVAKPEGWASPVQSDDIVLVAHRKVLVALESEDLAQRWRFPPDQDDINTELKEDKINTQALYGTPAIADGAVFLPTYDGTMYALDAEDGTIRWQFETGDALVGGPIFSDGTIYFGSSDGFLYALDAETGALVWQPFETGDSVWSTPTITADGEILYVTSLDSRLYALDAATGGELWSFDTDAGIAGDPVLDEDETTIYVGGFDSRLRAIDTETHEEIWSQEAGNWFWARPLLHDGVIYAASLDGEVFALNARDGAPAWAAPFSTEAPIRSAPLMAGDSLIIIDRGGEVHAIDPESGVPSLPNSPYPLESDVLADPILRPSPDAAGLEEILIVTTNGQLQRLGPDDLQPITVALELGD